jgi:hypothetical protein
VHDSENGTSRHFAAMWNLVANEHSTDQAELNSILIGDYADGREF